MVSLWSSLDKEKKTMEIVTISSKYQVVILRELRKQFNLKPGQKIRLIPCHGTLRVVVVPYQESTRMLKDISTYRIREELDE